jgi:hypothetical protein
MKLPITLHITLLAAAAAAVFGFIACTSTEIPPPVELNALYSLKIGDLDVTGIPEPILDEYWADEEYEVVTAVYETIVVKESGTSNKRIVAEVPDGARVSWGRAKGGNRPNLFQDTRAPASFELDDYLYIKVTSADDNNVVTSNYYRFSPYEASPVKELASITIANRDPTEQAIGTRKLTISDPAPNFEAVVANLSNNPSAAKGRIDITNGERGNAEIVAETKDTPAKVRYAVAVSVDALKAGSVSEFEEPIVEVRADPNDPAKTATVKVTNKDFTDGNILIVEVTAQNDNKDYCAFQVWVGRMATIARLEFNGTLAAGKGLPGSWATKVPGKFATADQTNGTGNYNITLQLDDPEGDYGWVKASSIPAAAPAATEFNKTTPLDFSNGHVLVLRVQSAERRSEDIRFYVVQMELLATDFVAHPKSAVYNVKTHSFPVNQKVLISATPTAVTLADGETVESLTVTLGKSGSFSYQWYEANSWYGGYGFDRDGRIQGDADYGSDVTSSDLLTGETVQQAKDRLGSGLGLDEKNNVSLHNGGNNYYRLVVPGRPIPGASGTITGTTGISYTPKIDSNKRPFIGGYSNQTHYYWVVVTDTATSLKATSDRATIVTEWGEIWDLGKPTGNKVTKKHHIVDLHAGPGGEGLNEPAKNVEPFTFKRQVRRIPVTFPAGFNHMDYSVAICQAKFFLGDGKEWIQNWTQGDIGFGRDGETDVIYYNLTNNNATLGLNGDAKEPQGGSLTFIPTHIVVKPAGEKPPKQMPPFEDKFDELGRPIPENINDAQGWFTPYIEIIELRFEGPGR